MLLLLTSALIHLLGISAPGRVTEKHKVEKFFWRHEVILAIVAEIAPVEVVSVPRAGSTTRLTLLKSVGVAQLVVLTALSRV